MANNSELGGLGGGSRTEDESGLRAKTAGQNALQTNRTEEHARAAMRAYQNNQRAAVHRDIATAAAAMRLGYSGKRQELMTMSAGGTGNFNTYGTGRRSQATN